MSNETVEKNIGTTSNRESGEASGTNNTETNGAGDSGNVDGGDTGKSDSSVVDPQLEAASKRSKPDSNRSSLSLNSILSPDTRTNKDYDDKDKVELTDEKPDKANFDNLEGRSNGSSYSSNGGTNSGLNVAISENIEGTPSTDDSSLLDEAMIKSNPRTKLGIQDIRIILYLIITIKPFKYIGDRTLSQTKKWELIQTEFSKFKHQRNHTNVVIPTIRTLQRQLSSAIKKAKQRRKSVLGANHDTPLFKTITMDHSLDDLELACLELFELSETLKDGKLANSSLLEYSLILNNEIDDNDKKLNRNIFAPDAAGTTSKPGSQADQSVSGGDQSRSGSIASGASSKPSHFQQPIHFAQASPTPPPPFGYAPPSYNHNSGQPLGAMYSMPHQPPMPVPYPYPSNVPGSTIGPGLGEGPVTAEVLNELNDTRKSIKNILTVSADKPGQEKAQGHDKEKGHDIVKLLESLINKSNQLQQETHSELVRLIDRNNQMIESNKRFQAQQNDINKSLITDVLSYLKDHPHIPTDTVDSIRQLI